jgi:uncharacterized protein YjbI with pentapeptide repeats
LFAALAAMAGLARADAASAEQGPRIVAVEGFAFEPNHGEGLRVAALVLSRYPDVQARDYPKHLRAHLRFRAHARLDVFDGEARIARGREAESLPVAAKRHSLRFVHLLLFSPTESAAILAADDPQATPARGLESDGADESVETRALSVLEVTAKGEVLESSSVEEEALVGLSDQAPPRVVNGCVILPRANCSQANLSFADLSGADLHHAILFHAHFYRADLSRTDLSDALLYNARLTYANLSGANLSGANLSFADLSGANLSDANLTYANLSGADLSGANLSDADLHHANLFRPNLSGAKFCNTTWTDGSVKNSGC